VKLALEYGASRIGHGVRSFEDPEVIRLLKENQIPLEMCPTSNRQTHAVEDMSAYPFMEYLRQGLKVTLNTDDPGIEGTTLAREFRYMEQTFGLTAAEERVLLENSVEAAFTTEKVKEWLRSELGFNK
jgi:adenosine deaminase